MPDFIELTTFEDSDFIREAIAIYSEHSKAEVSTTINRIAAIRHLQSKHYTIIEMTKELGINYKALYRFMSRYGLHPTR